MEWFFTNLDAYNENRQEKIRGSLKKTSMYRFEIIATNKTTSSIDDAG